MKIYAEFDFSSFVVEVEVITPPPSNNPPLLYSIFIQFNSVYLPNMHNK